MSGQTLLYQHYAARYAIGSPFEVLLRDTIMLIVRRAGTLDALLIMRTLVADFGLPIADRAWLQAYLETLQTDGLITIEQVPQAGHDDPIILVRPVLTTPVVLEV